MKTSSKSLMLLLVALASVGAGNDAAAKEGGCARENLATYQLGQTRFIDAENDMDPGTPVAHGNDHGEGKVLLRCVEGVAHFRGTYAQPLEGGLIPLYVNNQRAGLGIRVTLRDNNAGPVREFPHAFDETFKLNDAVTSDEDDVAYEVVRMTGPIVFGAVDTDLIAQQSVSLPGSGAEIVFREMKIYEMTIRRPTCSITPDTLDQTVEVGDYNLSNFATPDRATPWVRFRLTVQECAEPVGLVAKFTFGTQNDADGDNPDLFRLTGPQNVGLELGNADKKTMRPGEEIRMNALGTGKDYEFYVRLRETKPTVRGGVVKLPVAVLVEFEG
ncbi:fimbrial protein [Luteibacter sp. 329MFSha]|uniref:fimbrial protein n=1 Tax=Luteibacter sp. 329MFSha TaxID=1798239 RepID=UPI0008AED232|nr:fimbrial protein [Luteibacter sp. 329MFSha]SEW28428.1 Pilin (type 1 fimbria component protein) [Luteibacter sp. 329MFSha]